MQKAKLKQLRLTTIIFGLSILGFLVASVAYLLMFKVITTTGDHTATLRTETDALAAKVSEVGELKKTLASIQAEQPTLNSYFIDANDIVPLLETIEGYAKETNVIAKFNDVSIQQSPAALTVSLRSDGTFSDLYRFISLVEAAPYQFTVTAFDIQLVSGEAPIPGTVKGPQVPQGIQWEASMTLSVSSITGVTPPAPAPAPAK